jgi:hypothetical protein
MEKKNYDGTNTVCNAKHKNGNTQTFRFIVIRTVLSRTLALLTMKQRFP